MFPSVYFEHSLASIPSTTELLMPNNTSTNESIQFQSPPNHPRQRPIDQQRQQHHHHQFDLSHYYSSQSLPLSVGLDPLTDLSYSLPEMIFNAHLSMRSYPAAAANEVFGHISGHMPPPPPPPTTTLFVPNTDLCASFIASNSTNTSTSNNSAYKASSNTKSSHQSPAQVHCSDQVSA